MLISIKNLLALIESNQFFEKILFINNVNSFIFFLKHSDEVKSLVDIAKSEESSVESLESRIFRILQFDSENQSLHQYDPAAAIYLYAIYSADVERAEKLIKKIGEIHPPNFWFTWWICSYIAKNTIDSGTDIKKIKVNSNISVPIEFSIKSTNGD
jgi:hypothetical protein